MIVQTTLVASTFRSRKKAALWLLPALAFSPLISGCSSKSADAGASSSAPPSTAPTWTTYASPEGGYTALMFGKVSTSDRPQKSEFGDITEHKAECDNGGVTYSVIYADYASKEVAAITPQEYYDKSFGYIPSAIGATLLKKWNFMLQGHLCGGIQIRLGKDDGFLEMHGVKVGKRLYELSVSNYRQASIPPDKDKFFNSFTLQSP